MGEQASPGAHILRELLAVQLVLGIHHLRHHQRQCREAWNLSRGAQVQVLCRTTALCYLRDATEAAPGLWPSEYVPLEAPGSVPHLDGSYWDYIKSGINYKAVRRGSHPWAHRRGFFRMSQPYATSVMPWRWHPSCGLIEGLPLGRPWQCSRTLTVLFL